MAVYVDDIMLMNCNSAGLVETKEYLRHHFVTKDMGKPKYFLRIEVAHQKHNVLLSQKMFALDFLEETRFIGCKPISTPMKANVIL